MQTEQRHGYELIGDARNPYRIINITDRSEYFHMTNRRLGKIDKELGGLLKIVLRHLIQTVSAPVRILDIAGGTKSQLALDLSSDVEFGSHVDVTNVDILTRDTIFSDNARAIQGDALNLKPERFPDSNFHLTIANQFIPWLSTINNYERHQRAFLQMARVLKPGGVGIVSDGIFTLGKLNILSSLPDLVPVLSEKEVEFLPQPNALLTVLMKQPVPDDLRVVINSWYSKFSSSRYFI